MKRENSTAISQHGLPSRNLDREAAQDFYDWQLEAFDRIEGRSAVLSAPTGSGKTLVAYLWAGLLDREGQVCWPDARRVVFTAPIKALSNERYMDLRRMGLDVGIETGDFKRNEGARIICCTQEIYTMKYADQPDQKLIMQRDRKSAERSEERRVGKECRSRWSPYH